MATFGCHRLSAAWVRDRKCLQFHQAHASRVERVLEGKLEGLLAPSVALWLMWPGYPDWMHSLSPVSKEADWLLWFLILKIFSIHKRMEEGIGQLCDSMPIWLMCHCHLHSPQWNFAVSQHSSISLQAPMVSLRSQTGLLYRSNVVLATGLRLKLFVLFTNKDIVLFAESHNEA